MTVVTESYEATMPTACAEHIVTEHELAAYRHLVRSTCDDRAVVDPLVEASPVYPYVLTSRTFSDALRSLADPGGEGVTLPTPVHLSEEIRIHRPLRIGERILVTSALVGVRPDPRGARVALRSQLTIPDGAAVAELLTTALLVGDLSLMRCGHVPLQRGRGGAIWTSSVTRRIPRDLPRRYAHVSGKEHPVHLHPRVANVVGFPDVVAPGMAIVAIASEEIIDRYAHGDPRRVRGVGARFSGPVIPGEPLEFCTSDVDGGIVHFCCRTERGVAVRKAWVEIGGTAAVQGVDVR